MSSTIPAVSGSSSETSVPHWPWWANLHGLPKSFLLAAIDEAEVDVAAVVGAVVLGQLGLGIEQDRRATARRA